MQRKLFLFLFFLCGFLPSWSFGEPFFPIEVELRENDVSEFPLESIREMEQEEDDFTASISFLSLLMGDIDLFSGSQIEIISFQTVGLELDGEIEDDLEDDQEDECDQEFSDDFLLQDDRFSVLLESLIVEEFDDELSLNGIDPDIIETLQASENYLVEPSDEDTFVVTEEEEEPEESPFSLETYELTEEYCYELPLELEVECLRIVISMLREENQNLHDFSPDVNDLVVEEPTDQCQDTAMAFVFPLLCVLFFGYLLGFCCGSCGTDQKMDQPTPVVACQSQDGIAYISIPQGHKNETCYVSAAYGV
mmetsp:Transcript_21753/g.29916  ORF Transcript_21753/g.29916 Transcript_21753/m.29916 type:complete len:308 (-) Transcript_21753:67-990(-)